MEKNTIPANTDNDLKYRTDIIDLIKNSVKKKTDDTNDPMIESAEDGDTLQYFTE